MVASFAAIGLFFVGQALSQDAAPEDNGGGRRGARGNRGNFDPEQMRQRMAERMKTTLGATDEEWKVIQPKLEKVQTLSRQTRGGMGMRGGRMGGRQGAQGGRRARGRQDGQGGDGAAAPAREQTEVQKAAAGLREVLDNKDAGADEVKTALKKYRSARDKAKEELTKAQDELKEVLTVRQEAQLVTMGLLD
jgi:hypothetical protein